jgi:hypothetical protein
MQNVSGRREMHKGFWWGNMTEKDHFGNSCKSEDNIKVDV